MNTFIHECFSAFGSFLTWAFSTSSGLGVSVAGLIIGMDLLYVLVFFLWKRYK